MTTTLQKALAQLTKAVNTQKNPAKRKGTVSPKRKSQATKKAPSKRLVANTKKGYFPNPSEIKKAHAANDSIMPYIVQMEMKSKWSDVAQFGNKQAAIKYAKALGVSSGKPVRLMGD